MSTLLRLADLNHHGCHRLGNNHGFALNQPNVDYRSLLPTQTCFAVYDHLTSIVAAIIITAAPRGLKRKHVAQTTDSVIFGRSVSTCRRHSFHFNAFH